MDRQNGKVAGVLVASGSSSVGPGVPMRTSISSEGKRVLRFSPCW